jgi:hypothetical protein
VGDDAFGAAFGRTGVCANRNGAQKRKMRNTSTIRPSISLQEDVRPEDVATALESLQLYFIDDLLSPDLAGDFT